jgi:DNA invertase Pin-like site-specific DNA recombinase
MTMTIFAGTAEFERYLIRERISAGRERQKRKPQGSRQWTAARGIRGLP